MMAGRSCYWILEPVVSDPTVLADGDVYLVFGEPGPAAAFVEAAARRNPYLRLDTRVLYRAGDAWHKRDLAMLGREPWLHWTERQADLLAALPPHAAGTEVPDTGCRMTWPVYWAWLGTLVEHPLPLPWRC